MAASPDWKVYDASGKYQAACKEPEAAAALVAFYGDGATIRYGHSRGWAFWREGSEEAPASESYDIVARTLYARLHEAQNVAFKRHYGAAALARC